MTHVRLTENNTNVPLKYVGINKFTPTLRNKMYKLDRLIDNHFGNKRMTV